MIPVYSVYVLRDIVSWRARLAAEMKRVADSYVRMAQHGVPKRIICFMLASIHMRLSDLKADATGQGFNVARYVGERVVSRMEQIYVSLYTVYSLYYRGYIAWDTYARIARILNDESYAAYVRWRSFEKELEDAWSETESSIDDALSYVEQLMDRYCME